MPKSLLFLAILLAVSCIDQQDRQDWTQQITYTRDNKTGLCFGSLFLGSQAGALTLVPCTPAVEALIGDKVGDQHVH
jgi:hypothetical protein